MSTVFFFCFFLYFLKLKYNYTISAFFSSNLSHILSLVFSQIHGLIFNFLFLCINIYAIITCSVHVKLLVCKSFCHIGVTLEVSPWSQLMWSSFITKGLSMTMSHLCIFTILAWLRNSRFVHKIQYLVFSYQETFTKLVCSLFNYSYFLTNWLPSQPYSFHTQQSSNEETLLFLPSKLIQTIKI